MSLSKGEKGGNVFQRAFNEYIRLLQQRPVITKAITSSVVAASGTLISQILVKDPRAQGRINWRNVFAYASFGFLLSGPLVHHLYAFMEKHMPREKKYSSIKRLLFDRLIFAPPFLLLFLYYVAIVEGVGPEAAIKRIKESYWTILKLNWTVWTVIQFIIVNYIPLKYRTVVGNLCSLVWMIALSILRRKASSS